MATRWQLSTQVYKRYMRDLAIMYEQREDIRTYVELLLTLAIITIFGLFAIRPTAITISELLVQINEKQDVISKLDSKIDALNAAQQAFDQNRDQIALLNESIPAQPLPEIQVRQVEGIAQQDQVRILNMDVGETNVLGKASSSTDKQQSRSSSNKEVVIDPYPSDLSSMSYTTDMGGSYANILQSLIDLEQTRRPVFMDSTTMRVSDGDIPEELILSVSTRVPYLPNE